MMKLILLVGVVLIAASNANILSRSCKCKAVSHSFHVPFHSWDGSSCKFCSCTDVAMTNCESFCKAIVENYANSGCGKGAKGAKIKYFFEASNCNSGYGKDEHVCA